MDRLSEFCINEESRIRRFACAERERGGDHARTLRLMALADELKTLIRVGVGADD